MNAPRNNHLTPADVIAILRTHYKRWLIPTVLGGLLGAAYAAVRPDQWEASQALLIRNEAASNVDGPGKFRQLDDMKVVQETILELAKSRQVLDQALETVGPPNGQTPTPDWPTAKDIDKLRKHVKFAPPKGAEFGKTQVFYLKVVDDDRQRAVALASAICDALQAQFQEVLTRQAESMVRELTNTVELAQKGVNEASEQLTAMEREVGSDLAELRILHASPAASSELRQRVVFLEGELRRITTQRKTNEELLEILQAAKEDPQNLIAAPNSLLESQPSLRRLKEGLVDAQLKTSQVLGSMTNDHPVVKAAIESERAVRADIYSELGTSIRGLHSDNRLLDGHAEIMKARLDETDARLERIAEMRTRYSNLVSNVDHANKLLQNAETTLADARGKQSGAVHASLIDRIDTPDTGIRPIGPGRATIVLGGLMGGFIAGLGIVVLTVPITQRVETTADLASSTLRNEAPLPQPATPTQPESAPSEPPRRERSTTAPRESRPAEKPLRVRPAPRVPAGAGDQLTLKEALSRVQPSEAGKA